MAEQLFNIVPKGNARYQLFYRGAVLFDEIAPTARDDNAPPALQENFRKLEDGSSVWNVWDDGEETRFRFEAVLSADGSRVELSFLGEAPAFTAHRNRLLTIKMPYRPWLGASYRGYIGHARNGAKEANGVFTEELPNDYLHGDVWRWFALDGGDGQQLLFDLDTYGPTNPCPFYPTGVIRCWNIKRDGDHLEFISGKVLPPEGGLTGTKLVLCEGRFEQFSEVHAISKYNYNQHIAARTQDSFGAVRTGNNYFHWDARPYDVALGRGWTALNSPVMSTGAEGAYYSSLSGEGGAFLFKPLPNGFHLFHLGIGNTQGTPNSFSLRLNGRTMVEKLSVSKGQVAEIVLPVWVTEGEAKLEFDGRFLLSNLSDQFVLTEQEDYSFKRGFWVTEGFEPAFYFRSANYNSNVDFKATVSLLPLPEQGHECDAPQKPLDERVELPDSSTPELAWCNNVRIRMMGTTFASLNEFMQRSSDLERFMKETKELGYTVVMTSGMHGRHLFPATLDKGVENIGTITEAAHRHGLKVIDHHDTTYMENWEQGVRVMAERAGELGFCVNDFNPTPQFCLSNPVFTQTYRNYVKKLLSKGIDALQADELFFYQHGCLCPACREAFHRDTNWYLPYNELDPRLTDHKSSFWKLWFAWRNAQIGNWWVDFRRDIKGQYPHFVLSMYGCHWEQMKSQPRYNMTTDLGNQGRAVTLFGTEVMTRNPYCNARSLLPYRRLYNMYRLGFNAPPIWTWYYTKDWNVAYFSWAVSNMMGQCAMLDDPTTLPPDGSDFPKFSGSSDNPPLTTLTSAARVAFWLNAASRDYNSVIGVESELGGLTQCFEQTHIPYDIIEDHAFRNDELLARYKVLFVGSAGCLTDDDVVRIKTFAREGGTVWLGCVAGFFDRWGNERAAWPFKDVFGDVPQWRKPQKLTEISLHNGASLNLAAWENPYKHVFPISCPPEGRVLLSGKGENGGEMPLLIGVKYGKGEILYMASVLYSSLFCDELQKGNKWPYKGFPELEAILRAALAECAEPAAIWSVNTTDLVYTNILRQKNGTLCLHFLNGNGTQTPHGFLIENAPPGSAWPPIHGDVTFTLKNTSPKEIYAVSPDFAGRVRLAFTQQGSDATVVLPKERLKAYTLVVVQ